MYQTYRLKRKAGVLINAQARSCAPMTLLLESCFSLNDNALRNLTISGGRGKGFSALERVVSNSVNFGSLGNGLLASVKALLSATRSGSAFLKASDIFLFCYELRLSRAISKI